MTFEADLAQGRWDVPYFSRRFLGVNPHPGEIRMWDAMIRRDATAFRPAYLTVCVAAGNRAGKTLGLAIAIFHHALYKIGFPTPEISDERALRSWLTLDYEWYHFGIQQEVGELVFWEIARLLDGNHEAQQGRGCPLTEELGVAVADWSKKYRGDYPWIRLHPLLGGAQIHFRTTSERAIGSLGKDMHGISWDECAFDPQFNFIVDEVLHLRRLGTGGPLWLISTQTEGLTAFTDRWREGDPEAPDRKPDTYSLRISTRENIGFGINEAIFARLTADMPDYLVPQNIDGYAIESRSAFFGSQAVDACFTHDLDEEDVPPTAHHRYSHGVDPALTFDQSWSVILDFTDPKHTVGVRARRKTGRQTTTSVAAMVIEGHRTYNARHTVCHTALDVTGFGGKAFRDSLGRLHPLRQVEFGGHKQTKVKMLLNLKDAIEKGWLTFPRVGLWLVLRRQLLGYKLDDRKLSQDAVMALALAWSTVARQPGVVSKTASFDYFSAGTQRVSSRREVRIPLTR